jgi:4-amino-4-deoxy-L-arabinose transferase-like glycosyltransferase
VSPNSPLLMIMLLAPLILLAGVVGALSGLIVASLLRLDRGAVWWDALWAPLAFLVVGYLALAVPCARCEYVRDGWTLRNKVPYPELWAFGAACLIPVLHQLLRRLQRTADR